MQDTSVFTRVLMQDTSVFTRVLMQMVRTPVIETRSSEWHSDARPSSYARIGGEWTESNLLPEGTAFTAQRRHQPVLIGIPQYWIGIPQYWLQRIESNDLPRGYEPRELPMLHAASKVARLALTRMRRSTSVHSQNWRKAANSNRTPVKVPTAFQAVPVRLPG